MTGQGSAPRSRLVRVSGFELAYLPDDPAAEAELRRRYSVLFADESTRRRGGLGSVCLVTNACGEKLALKELLPQGASDAGQTPVVPEARLAAFRAEYDAQRSLAGLPCVPALCGWGMVEGLPVILMEWVGGVTLDRARAELAVDDEGRVSPSVAVALGRDLFSALADLAQAPAPVVHRDVSPANVMVRTDRRGLARQVADGVFDLCLVDFGSAVAPVREAEGRTGSLTRSGALLRWATPDYAPPEMLTDDVPGVAELRGSSAIDVYAAASVVYDLACGRPPFGRVDDPPGLGASPYRTKMDATPAPVVMAHAEPGSLDAVLPREPLVAQAVAMAVADLPTPPSAGDCACALSQVDAQAAAAILPCLAPSQQDRPTAAEVRDRLAVVAARYDENVGHALRGEPLEPRWVDAPTSAASPGGAVAASPLAARRSLRVAALACSLGMTTAVCALASPRLGAAALCLVLPLAWALLLRGGNRTGASSLVRGGAGIVLGAVLAMAALSFAQGPAPSLPGETPAVLAACAAAWLPVAVDYATLTATAAPPATQAAPVPSPVAKRKA